jgi:hypothetical protein
MAANAPAPQLIPSGSASGGMVADAGGVKSEPSQDVKGLSVCQFTPECLPPVFGQCLPVVFTQSLPL